MANKLYKALEDLGVLEKAFILTAIDIHVSNILSMEKPKEHGNGLISAIAWYETAVILKEKLNER